MAEVTIYTTPTCPYCMRAKQLLKDLGFSYQDINVLEHEAEHAELRETYNWHTVPMIFIGDEFIGGYDDMAKLHAAGQLIPKLQA